MNVVVPPPSKSHYLRLMLADFLAGDSSRLVPDQDDCSDVREMKAVLAGKRGVVINSAAVARMLSPVREYLPIAIDYQYSSRLASRLKTTATSQTLSGELFAAPLKAGNSIFEISRSLPSRGYVEMTLQIMKGAGIKMEMGAEKVTIGGGQRYHSQPQTKVEADWSSAAFLYAAQALGADIGVEGLKLDSLQPDRRIVEYLKEWPSCIDISPTPDLFPVLTVLAAAKAGVTHFIGTGHLRFKESDRIAAMATTLRGLGRRVEVGEDDFTVYGEASQFNGGRFQTFADHRVAMALAVASLRVAKSILLDDWECVAKSYPAFWTVYPWRVNHFMFDKFGKI